MTTSKADEKPKAFQEACAEDSKPKFDRQGKNCVAMPTGNFGEDDEGGKLYF